MKTYAYLITKRPNDRNGNPRDLVTVYRIKGNRPRALLTTDVGYRSNWQAAVEELIEHGEIPGKYWLSTVEIANNKHPKFRLYEL